MANYNFLEVPQNIVSYVTDKAKSGKSYFKYLLSRTQMMFKYTNLPETIDPIILERMLQVNGVACISDYNDNLYAFSGQLGGELDVYYRPTKFTISNPHLSKDGFFKECDIYPPIGQPTKDFKQTGVLLYNDSEWQGLTSLIARYASLMTENVLTVRVADIMLRKMDIIIAGTDKAYKSSQVFLKKLENGELAALTDSAFMESIRTLPVSNYNGSYLIQFIELQQYLKGSFYNELGLRANYNMKREAIGEGESTLDADSVLPLCENMLNSRRKCIALVNQVYGTDISVDYNSAWLENHIDSYLSIYNKIAESVSTMPGQATPVTMPGQVGQPTVSGQPMMNGGQSDCGASPCDLGATEGQVEKSGNSNESGSNKVSQGDSGASEKESKESSEAGEDRRESGTGVGRSGETTGQDEELIELEEVVEKMIDKVYDGVVNEEYEQQNQQSQEQLVDQQGQEQSQEQSQESEESKKSNESEVKKDE